MCEGDINSLEQERERLQKKLELLEKALESPGSRQVWRRVLERCVCVCVCVCVCYSMYSYEHVCVQSYA